MEKQKIREEKKSKGILLDSESDEDNHFLPYQIKEKSEKTDCTWKPTCVWESKFFNHSLTLLICWKLLIFLKWK